MLDTFNEVLIQSYSQKHPSLKLAYASAAGKNPHLDYGNWLHNGTFKRTMDSLAIELLKVHDARVKSDLAHARTKKGKRTRALTYPESHRLVRTACKA